MEGRVLLTSSRLDSPNVQKTNVLSLQILLCDKFPVWACFGSSVEETLNNYKNIVYESIELFVQHKILRKYSDPEYSYKEIKRLKANVRKEYNRRKLGAHHREKLKQLSKRLLAAKKSAQEPFLKSVLSKEGKC